MDDIPNLNTLFLHHKERPALERDSRREYSSQYLIIHGVFLEVHGLGVLLTGSSGVGKSELALELITRGHHLIADDAPEFSRNRPDTIHGTCPELLRDFLEVRGLGILNIRAMYGDSAVKRNKNLNLVIHLEKKVREEFQRANRLESNSGLKKILDVDIPVLTLATDSGRNLAVLVEAAARQHILLRKGYNASESFISQQQEIVHQQSKHQLNPGKK